MLKKKNRVNSSLFGVTVKKGFGCFNKNISLKIIKTADIGVKFGVSISKKELKTAVKRNLLKRRTLSILRKIKPQTNQGFSCVFFLKKGALYLPHQRLQDEIIFLLQKAKILQGNQ